jgi:hypothetical protein
MPCIKFPIEPSGPTLDAGISIPQSLLADPPVHWFSAIADTGCSDTAIHSSVALSCGLCAIGKSSITTPAGIADVNRYYGDLYLRSPYGHTPWVLENCTFVEMPCKHSAFDVLLGMDVLGMGILTIDGPAGSATFCW